MVLLEGRETLKTWNLPGDLLVTGDSPLKEIVEYQPLSSFYHFLHPGIRWENLICHALLI
jgi:hypothetical protein